MNVRLFHAYLKLKGGRASSDDEYLRRDESAGLEVSSGGLKSRSRRRDIASLGGGRHGQSETPLGVGDVDVSCVSIASDHHRRVLHAISGFVRDDTADDQRLGYGGAGDEPQRRNQHERRDEGGTPERHDD